MSHDDPFDPIHEQRARWLARAKANDNPFSDSIFPPIRREPRQSPTEILRELDARIAAEVAAIDERDRATAKAAAELALHLPPPKPFTS